MTAVIKIAIQTTASGGAQQVIGDLNAMDGAARRAQGGFGGLGGAIMGALGTASVAAIAGAGAAMAGFLASSVTAAAGFEQQMSGIKAVLAPTGAEFDALRQKALDLGASTAYGAAEAAEAIEMLAKNGLSATEILGGAADATLALAAATGGDLAGAADIMTDAMAIFGISAENVGEAIDGITGVTVASKFTIDDYRLALAQAGGVAGSVGVEFDDFNTAIAGISPLFASGSDAGTSFKTMLQRLAPTTGPAKDAMAELGLYSEEAGSAFFDAQGNLKDMAEVAGILQAALGPLSEEQKNVALSTIFGTDAMRAAVGLANLGTEGFNELAGSIGQVDAAAQAATRLDNFSGALEQLKGAFETLQIQVGSYLLPYLTAFLNDVVTPGVNVLGEFADTIAEAGLFSIEFAEHLSVIHPALQPLWLAISELAAVIAANWQPALAAVGVVIAAVVIPALASFVVSIAPVLAAVAAAIAIGMALYNAWNSNFMGIQTLTQGAMAAVQGVITSVMGVVLTFWQNNGAEIMAFAQTTWQRVQQIIGGIVAIVAAIVTRVFNTIKGFLDTHGDEIQVVLKTAWKGIENVIKLAMGVIQGIVTTVLGIIEGDWQKAADGINGIVKSIKTFITDEFERIKTFITEIGPDFIAAAKSVGEDIVQGIADGISAGAAWVADAAKDAAQAALDAAKGLLGISSPSRAFAEQVGLPSAQGIAMGLGAGVPVVAAAGAGAAGAALAGGRSVVSNSTRNITYNATFNGVGSADVSDAIARSLAGV